ncbi:hypothetical protein CR513_47986, partial [Mucuna pruriens]
MKHLFLEKFFLSSRTAAIRKEICGIRQHSRRHYMNIGRGLLMMDRNMVNATSRGVIGQYFFANLFPKAAPNVHPLPTEDLHNPGPRLPPTTVSSSCSVSPVMARIWKGELSSSVPAHPNSPLLTIIPLFNSWSCVRSSLSDHRIEVSWNKEVLGSCFWWIRLFGAGMDPILDGSRLLVCGQPQSYRLDEVN